MAYGLYSLEIVFRSWAQGSIENLECGIPGHDRRGNQACHEIRQIWQKEHRSNLELDFTERKAWFCHLPVFWPWTLNSDLNLLKGIVMLVLCN